MICSHPFNLFYPCSTIQAEKFDANIQHFSIPCIKTGWKITENDKIRAFRVHLYVNAKQIINKIGSIGRIGKIGYIVCICATRATIDVSYFSY